MTPSVSIYAALFVAAVSCVVSGCRGDVPVASAESDVVDSIVVTVSPSGLRVSDFSLGSIIGVQAIASPSSGVGRLRARLDRRGHLRTDSLWPIVTERPLWIIAAHECWLSGGSHDWLREAYDAGREALATDMAVMYDACYGLMHGVLPYPDGSVTSMPAWMREVDKFESFSLATNVAYYRALVSMADMADALDEDSEPYKVLAEKLRTAVNNRFWIPECGRYSPLLYGYPYPIQSVAVDWPAMSMAVSAGIANGPMGKSVMDAGLSGDSLSAKWSRVLVAHAACTAGDERVAGEMLSGITSGYGQNSADSVAVATSLLRVLAGIRLTSRGMRVAPCLCADVGSVQLRGLVYRDAVLNIEICGQGSHVTGFVVDGEEIPDRIVPASLTGEHTVCVTVEPAVSSGSPLVDDKGGIRRLTGEVQEPEVLWRSPRRAIVRSADPDMEFEIRINGMTSGLTSGPDFELDDSHGTTSVAFVPVINGAVGFASRPHLYLPYGALTTIEAERVIRGGTALIKEKKMAGKFVEVSASRNVHLTFVVDVRDAGLFFVRLNYADGTSESPVAFRRLQVDGEDAGVFVMPRTGAGPSTRVSSNLLPVKLGKGRHVLVVDRFPGAPRPSGSILLDNMQLIRK